MNVVAAKKNRTESEFKSREYSFLFFTVYYYFFFTFDSYDNSYDNPYQQTAVVTSSKIKKPMKNTP